MKHQTETLDRCYLEYSQLTQARTSREIALTKLIFDMALAYMNMDKEGNFTCPKGLGSLEKRVVEAIDVI